jgi:hypothetical protein
MTMARGIYERTGIKRGSYKVKPVDDVKLIELFKLGLISTRLLRGYGDAINRRAHELFEAIKVRDEKREVKIYEAVEAGKLSFEHASAKLNRCYRWVWRLSEAGMKTCTSGPEAGMKTCTSGPEAGMKTCTSGPEAGMKTCTSGPEAGMKTCTSGPEAVEITGMKVCLSGTRNENLHSNTTDREVLKTPVEVKGSIETLRFQPLRAPSGGPEVSTGYDDPVPALPAKTRTSPAPQAGTAILGTPPDSSAARRSPEPEPAPHLRLVPRIDDDDDVPRPITNRDRSELDVYVRNHGKAIPADLPGYQRRYVEVMRELDRRLTA